MIEYQHRFDVQWIQEHVELVVDIVPGCRLQDAAPSIYSAAALSLC